MKTSKWTIVVASVAILAFALGVWTSPRVIDIIEHEPVGTGLKCLNHGQICVGMKANEKLSSDSLGTFIFVDCGLRRGGVRSPESMVLTDLVEGQCASTTYSAIFNQRDHLINVWVENGVIVQLDRDPWFFIDF